MKNLIFKLLVKAGVLKDFGAPVHAGVSPVYFTNVYENENGWVFSWRSEDHSKGEVREGIKNKADALSLRDFWASKRSVVEHARCVNETV